MVKKWLALGAVVAFSLSLLVYWVRHARGVSPLPEVPLTKLLEEWWGELAYIALPAPGAEGLAYAGLGTNLVVFRRGEGDKLAILNRHRVRGFIRALVVRDRLLYVAAGWGGLVIFDVRDPAHPTFLNRLRPHGYVVSVVFGKDYGYVGLESGGVYLISFGKDGSPRLEGRIVEGRVNHLLLEGDRLYVADVEQGVLLYDLTDPLSPRLVGGEREAPAPDALRWFMVKEGDYLMVASGREGVRIFDVSRAQAIREVARIPGGFVVRLHGEGKTIYAADFRYGVQEADVSDPRRPVVRRRLPVPGQPSWISRWGEDLLVAAAAAGVQVWNVDADPPRLVRSYAPPASYMDLEMVGNLLMVAAGSGGLCFYDVSRPAEPRLLQRLPTPGYARRVAAAAGRAFVADVIGGVQEISFSEEEGARIVRSFNLEQHAWDVALSGRRLYVAGGSRGIGLFDVGQKGRPKKLWGKSVAEEGYSVAVAPDRSVVYLSDIARFGFDGGGVIVAEVGASGIAEHDVLPGVVLDLAVRGGYLFMAGYTDGLLVYDVREARRPVMLARLPTEGRAYGVSPDGERDLLYLADQVAGVLMVDIREVETPKIVQRFELQGTPFAVLRHGEVLYVAAGRVGLAVVDLRKNDVRYLSPPALYYGEHDIVDIS